MQSFVTLNILGNALLLLKFLSVNIIISQNAELKLVSHGQIKALTAQDWSLMMKLEGGGAL